MASRKQQQGELIFQLGSLLGPFLDITNNPSKFPTELSFKTRAKYMPDVNLFKEQVQNFVNGEAGYSYEIEWRKIQDEIDSFADNTLKNDFGNIPVFAQKLDIFRQNMLNELLSIPTSFETE